MGDAPAAAGKGPGPGLPGRPDGLFRAVPVLLHTPSHHRHKDSLTPQPCSHNLNRSWLATAYEQKPTADDNMAGIKQAGQLSALHHQAYSLPSLVSPPACGSRLFTASCRRRRGTHRVSRTKECRLARRVDLLLLQRLVCKLGLLIGAIQLQLLRKKHGEATVALGAISGATSSSALLLSAVALIYRQYRKWLTAYSMP